MKLTTAWAESEVDGEMPWLIAAYDEYTFDAWGGSTPDFFTEAVKRHGPDAEGNGPRVRILDVVIPEDAVTDLFEPPVVQGAAYSAEPEPEREPVELVPEPLPECPICHGDGYCQDCGGDGCPRCEHTGGCIHCEVENI